MKETVPVKLDLRKAAFGASVSLCVYLLLLAMAALLIVRGTLGEGTVKLLAWAFACVAAFAGARTSSHHVQAPLLPLTFGAVGFWLLTPLCGILAGGTPDLVHFVTLVFPVALGALASYLIGGGGTRKKSKRRRRRL